MNKYMVDFPDGPVAKTPHFYCRGHGFNPWLGNQDPACHMVWPPKKNRNVKSVIVLKNQERGDRPLLLPGKQNLLTSTPHVDPAREHPTPTERAGEVRF